jgi:hypothetical protein
MQFETAVAEGVAELELGLSPTGHFVVAKPPNSAVLPLARYGDVVLAIDGNEVQGKALNEVVAQLRAGCRPMMLQVASPRTKADRLRYYGSVDPLPSASSSRSRSSSSGGSRLLSFLIPSVACLMCYNFKPVTMDRLEVVKIGSSDHAVAADLAAKNQPFLMDSAAASWPAIKRWKNHSYLQEALGGAELQPVYVKPRRTPPVFWWVDQSRPLQVDIPTQHHHTVESLEVGNLLDRILYSRSSYLKCSARFAEPMFEALRQDTLRTPLASSLGNGTTVLWVGGKSAFQMHYDTSANQFVQVVGTKRVLLAAPRGWRHLNPFPHLHAAFGGSQVGTDDEGMLQPGSNASGHLVDVLVQPGDVLFIPPFWWHHFSCVTDLCISVSEWHHTPEYSVAGEATKLQRQWQWPQHYGHRVHVLHALSTKLLIRLHFIPHVFIRDAFILSRYGSLRRTAQLECGADAAGLLPSCAVAALSFDHPDAGSSMDDVEGLEQHVERLAAVLLRIEDEGAREMVAADFLEGTVADAIGAQHTCAFLTLCFQPPDGKSTAVLA